jgi:hypothetical protein
MRDSFNAIRALLTIAALSLPTRTLVPSSQVIAQCVGTKPVDFFRH